jgi:hypothetical protein
VETPETGMLYMAFIVGTVLIYPYSYVLYAPGSGYQKERRDKAMTTHGDGANKIYPLASELETHKKNEYNLDPQPAKGSSHIS